jgi:proteasome lid subunit RPN8/RPN11
LVFYVSISKGALAKVVDQAKSTPNQQVVGVLIGKMIDQTVVVEDAVTGEIEAEVGRATLRGEAIAKIADDIISKKIAGNVVGWYHSHPGYGIFMSDIDISTQSRLQQFSSYIVALVVDPSTGDKGFFTLDQETGNVLPLGDDSVSLYGPGEEAVPAKFKVPPTPEKIYPYRVYPRPLGRPTAQPTGYVVAVAALIVVLLVTSAFLGVTLLQRPPEIFYTPATTRVVAGTSIPVNVTVYTGGLGVQNATVYYKALSGSSWKSVAMKLDQMKLVYYATIPAADVTVDLVYFIEARDYYNRLSYTRSYAVAVQDFTIESSTASLSMYVESTTGVTITVKSLVDFNSEVSLSVSGAPPGVTAAFSNTKITPPKNGSAISSLSVTVSSTAPSGIYTLTISGASGIMTHSTKLSLTILKRPDFSITAQPASVSIKQKQSAEYQVTLTPMYGTIDTVSLNVTGVPLKSTYQFVVAGNRTSLGGPLELVFKVSTLSTTKVGEYTITITATGGGRVHSVTLTLEIKPSF